QLLRSRGRDASLIREYLNGLLDQVRVRCCARAQVRSLVVRSCSDDARSRVSRQARGNLMAQSLRTRPGHCKSGLVLIRHSEADAEQSAFLAEVREFENDVVVKRKAGGKFSVGNGIRIERADVLEA